MNPYYLRIALGLVLLAIPLVFGGLASSPYLILPLSVVFLIAYIGGKWPQWQAYLRTAGTVEILKNVAITLLVQVMLVSILFFVAYGVVSIFSSQPFAQGITLPEMSILAVAAAFFAIATAALGIAEKRPENTVQDEQPANASGDADGDLVMSEEPVTVANFFHRRHFSTPDHMLKALVGWADDDGSKVERVPPMATEAMIAETEKRLGVGLPETLHTLYRKRDGGSLPAYWVPAKADPGTDYEDWIDAFAYDYNDLRPLKELHFLIDDYMENFDPDYDDESDKEDWFPDAEKLVVLTRRYGVATLLDYRRSETEPGILLVDLDQDRERHVRKSYDTFDAFFAALRQERDGPAQSRRRNRSRLADGSYDVSRPVQFWANANSNASRGAADAEWHAAEARLGVKLPQPFRSLYAVLDGGNVGYPFLPQLGTDERGELRSPFAKSGSSQRLLPLSAWVSLAELSNRLSFPAAAPYAQLHEHPERLIVISASFDTALLLDYRNGTEPQMLYCPDLIRPETGVDLGTADTFLTALRQRAARGPLDEQPIADPRLAPRVANAETFWMPDTESVGANDESLAVVAETFGAEVPEGFVPFLKERNGGKVRFRYAPPVDGTRDHMGNPKADPHDPEWIDIFPGGIWPVEDWIGFAEFRRQHNVALDQDPRDELMPEMRTEPDVVERLIVIGADGHAAITLLDLSAGSFRKSTALSRTDYVPESDQYRLAVAPMTIRHNTHGVFLILRARLDELK